MKNETNENVAVWREIVLNMVQGFQMNDVISVIFIFFVHIGCSGYVGCALSYGMCCSFCITLNLYSDTIH